MAVRCRAKLAYDGTAYQGFQRQAGGTPTIQGAVEQAVTAVTGQRVTVIGAGRTDTGVHASGQVIAFTVDWAHSLPDLLRAINSQLPPDIALQDIREQPGFHPRFDAISREYQYTLVECKERQPLLRDRAWHIWGELDAEAMGAAAAFLVGWHDFAGFGLAPQGSKTTTRNLTRSEWSHWDNALGEGVIWQYTVEANAFLKHMVRRMVGLLVQVGLGKLNAAELKTILDRAVLWEGPVAPPQGLVLTAVRYPSDTSNTGS
ncbi:MAG: tRNA pseudouridine(38-40) synthase TruA [Anaerolineaceae bacterium]|nr:tRNA pseudouridine(38-40) synthase TruA [Anaerolineaceae bacterium]